MRVIDSYRKILITAFVVVFSAPVGASQKVSLGAIEFRVASGWSEKTDAASCESTGGFVATWSDPASKGANAVVDVRTLAVQTIVSSANIAAVRAGIERDLLAAREVIDFDIRGVEVTSVDGAPAYRIRSALRTVDREVDQHHLLVVSGNAHLFTFTTHARDYDSMEPRLQKVVESIEVHRKPSLSGTLPILGVGLFAGAVRFGRRRRTRLPC